ncbi:helicase associated domain-containing protein [Streptomyces zhihengii]
MIFSWPALRSAGTPAGAGARGGRTICSAAGLPGNPAWRRRSSRRGAWEAGGGWGERGVKRGVAALAHYVEREGPTVVPRGWCEDLPDGTIVRLGVWLSNARSRRVGLSDEQLSRLAALGIDWV